MDTNILDQVGLSKNEIKVYLALLELDQASATPILRKANIPNSKIYPVLEKLMKKGLASYVIKNNVKYFQASDPKNLIDILNNKEKQIFDQKKEITKLIERIETKRKFAKEKQEAIIYEGFEGVKAAFNDILQSLEKGKEYLVFTLGQELETKELKLFFSNYHQKRIERGIRVKLIANKEIKKIFSKYHKFKGMQIKYLKLQLPTGIFIYNDKVMTFVWENKPAAFVITSKTNAERYKRFFEAMWKTASK